MGFPYSLEMSTAFRLLHAVRKLFSFKTFKIQLVLNKDFD